MARAPRPRVALLDALPQPQVPAEPDPERPGQLRLVVPRFGGRVMSWLFGRLNPAPVHFRLDEVGSFVWQAFDGQRSLGQVAEAARAHFGERVEPAEERVATFAAMLRRHGFLRLSPPTDPGAAPGTPPPGSGAPPPAS